VLIKDRKTITYGRFQINAGILNGKPRAMAVQGTTRILERDGMDLDTAIASAKAGLDELEASRRKQRKAPYIGTVDDYVGAFQTIKLGEREKRMLHAHAHTEGRTLTATQIANAAGYEGHQQTNSQYGKLARRVAEAAGLARIDGEDGEDAWTFALATGEREEGEHWRWTMHPEVFDALRSLNIV
jgi:predicted HNH restriction endonuclease